MRLKRDGRTHKQQLVSWLIFTVIVFALVLLFSLSPALSEWYMRGIYPKIAVGLSFVSALFPFSVYDIFLIVAALVLLGIVFRAIMRKRTFVQFSTSLLRFVTVLVAWFYFAWGIAYFREDFYSRCKVEKTISDPDILKDFAIQFIERANQSYVDCSAMDKNEIRRRIESAYEAKHELLQINYPNGRRRAKPMLFEPIYSKTGVSGYFGPFFNEIHVNNYSLNFTYPFTLAHEMAHQFGVGTESEANLYAFVVCADSNDEILRYSAYVSTLRYVLNDIYRFLPDEYEVLRSTIRPEIVADLQQNRAHWLAARDQTLSDIQDKMYDAYLKTNKISSGQANYSEVVGLLISIRDWI